MFISQRMKKIDLIIMKKFADDVSKEIVKFGNFQTIEISGEKAEDLLLKKSVSDAEIARFSDLDKRVSYLISTFESIMENIEMWESEEITEAGMIDAESLEKNVKTIESEVNLHYGNIERLRNEQRENKIRIKKVDYFSTQEVDWTRSTWMTFFTMGFGSVPLAGYVGFESAMETLPTVIEKVDTIDDTVIVFYVAPSSVKEKVSQILKSVYFKNYGIPETAAEVDKSSLVHHAFELSSAYDEEMWQEKQFKKKILDYRQLLKTLKNSARYYIAMERLKGEMASSEKVCIFSGWVPSKITHRFKKKMEQLTQNRCEILERSASKALAEEGLIAPTKLSNPFFIRPFEMLVSTFGTPNYREIDPTPLLAVTFVLMYGAMFGDVGQGLALVLLGIIIFFIKKFKSFRNFGTIFIYVGVSSAFFGLMYGAVFGFENVIKAIWMKPMDRVMDILTLSIIYGSFVILLAQILNIINSILGKDYPSFLFSRNGLAGFGFYGSLVYVAICLIRGIHYQEYIFVFTIVCALLISLEKYLERLLFSHHVSGAEDEKPTVTMAVVEIYESVMGFLSNTISFIRVGAFALNHIALMSVVFVLSYSSKNPIVQWVGLFIGNIIVIGFEGFIVGIQVMRLEYYEFFTRFFRADGKAFEGIGVYKP